LSLASTLRYAFGMRSLHAQPAAVRTLLLLLLLGLVVGACTHAQPNVVAEYLDGAERQSETVENRKEIRRALRDMLILSPQELQQRRYADYEGTPQAWTAVELLERSFVPARQAALDPASFYRDLAAPRARGAIRKQLQDVERALSSGGP
jgi:hypothetical protein